ncbi:MAG: cytochrome c3 family protein [Candidatus Binatia bacterium]
MARELLFQNGSGLKNVLLSLGKKEGRKKMKHSRERIMKGPKMILAAFALFGFVSLTSGAWAAGIADTKHNLSTSGTGIIHLDGTVGTSPTTNICVFCHTPHGADTTVEAPLWNRAVTTSGYTPYSSPTLDSGTSNSAPQPTGASVACLSCHAGDIAFDALRNLPGSGGFDSNPAKTGVTDWGFTGTTDKKMPAGVTNLGLDLSNDHPVSILYTAAFSPSSSSGTNDHATGFKDPTGPISSTGDTYFANGLKLSKGLVQCTSCHDPHRSDNPTFLRIDNAGSGNAASAVCLTCHKKDS